MLDHTSQKLKICYQFFNWEVLSHAAHSPDYVLSDYHLFRSMQRGLANQHFKIYEDEEIKKWLNEWIASKDEHFFIIVKFTYVRKMEKRYS